MFKVKDIFKRQTDLVSQKDLGFPISIIGAGGIGSFTTLALAKMGCTDLTVIDFDKVSIHNVASQFYKIDQVGQDKVKALAENIKENIGVEIKQVNKKFQDFLKNGYSHSSVLICAVDSMEERIEIWRLIMENKKFDCYIDARMGGELLRILVVNPHDKNSILHYDSKLSLNVHKEPCTARSIVYNTFICGGLVASVVKKYAKKESTKFDIIFDITNLMMV
ncbi:MAG: ThiF family adenylyltransferase [Actinomycetota bacterium]